ncbi:U32 family peptidase [Microbacterium sp.]|uniref:U32 family peptidase n=1 Tax=Microbacterium sp. TaxID=51671 RepID=UPI003A847E38
MSDGIERALRGMGLPVADLHDLPTSERRFPDGGQYRIEIPSTEGPEGLDTVLAEARDLDVPLHRVSQGSGVLMLTDAELAAMARAAQAAQIELSLFARPTAGWGVSAASMSEVGASVAAAVRGADQLRDCLSDVARAAAAGVRGVLLSDIGGLRVFDRMRADGAVPADMTAKVSVMLPAANPATAQALEEMGAGSLNLPTDLDLSQIAAIRAAVSIPLDIYVEVPSNLGGFVRLTQIPELIRIAAPVYIKFGLRNGPDIYPTGRHLESAALAMSRERVRRARLGLEVIQRSGTDLRASPVAAADLRIPVPPSAEPSLSFNPQRGNS